MGMAIASDDDEGNCGNDEDHDGDDEANGHMV